MEQKFKQYGEDDNDFSAGFKIPETRLGTIQDVLQRAHQDEDEKSEREGKPKKRNKRKNIICCCGSPGCGIGPMQETEVQNDG